LATSGISFAERPPTVDLIAHPVTAFLAENIPANFVRLYVKIKEKKKKTDSPVPPHAPCASVNKLKLRGATRIVRLPPPKPQLVLLAACFAKRAVANGPGGPAWCVFCLVFRIPRTGHLLASPCPLGPPGPMPPNGPPSASSHGPLSREYAAPARCGQAFVHGAPRKPVHAEPLPRLARRRPQCPLVKSNFLPATIDQVRPGTLRGLVFKNFSVFSSPPLARPFFSATWPIHTALPPSRPFIPQPNSASPSPSSNMPAGP